MCKVPVEEKMLWSVKETAEISGLGINKIYTMAKKHPEIAFHNGPRNLMIKREQFTKFIAESSTTE